MSSKSGDFCGEAGSFLPTTGMVLWQNIQSGATAKASVELEVPGEDYGLAAEGDQGVLVARGDEFIVFKRMI